MAVKQKRPLAICGESLKNSEVSSYSPTTLNSMIEFVEPNVIQTCRKCGFSGIKQPINEDRLTQYYEILQRKGF